MGAPDVTVVIPALDEAASLPGVLAGARAAAAGAGLELELVGIDDGSRDATAGAFEREGAVLIRHPRPRGCHPSALEGFAAARGRWVLFLPADGQVPPEVLAPLVREAEARGLDALIGVRADRADPLHRRLLAGAYGVLRRRLLGLPYRDVDSATLYRREALQAVLGEVRSDSAAIAAEILMLLGARGGRIGELEIPHRARIAGRAKGVNWKDAWGVPRHLLRLALARRGGGRPSTS